jgi:hypothetical protein
MFTNARIPGPPGDEVPEFGFGRELAIVRLIVLSRSL